MRIIVGIISTLLVLALSLAAYFYFINDDNSLEHPFENIAQNLPDLPETSWLKLLPPEDYKALEQMPPIIHDGEELPSSFDAPGGLRQSQGLPDVMYSNKTVAALNGAIIRIGGYPVPLETNAKGEVTEFFLVPYPGACIHVPPPPPNQLIWVQSKKPFAVENIYYPIWVTGELKIEQISNDLGDAAYTMNAFIVREIGEDELDF